MIVEISGVFLTLFVIMDPIGGLPIFITLTKGASAQQMKKNANKALFVASILLFAFLFLGNQILDFFNISINSFQIAGGIVLAILGIQYVIGIHIKKSKFEKYDVASVPIGTPLLTGPGVITSTILLVSHYGIIITFIGAVLTLVSTWLVLRFAKKAYDIIGHQWALIISRIMGLILVAIAVEFVTKGVYGLL